jgi:hypothetical protein
MHNKENLSLLQMVGIVLTGLISLGVVLGWKFDNTVSYTAAQIKKEVSENYVDKDLYNLQVKVFDENIRAIGKAVGARMR